MGENVDWGKEITEELYISSNHNPAVAIMQVYLSKSKRKRNAPRWKSKSTTKVTSNLYARIKYKELVYMQKNL